MKQMLNRLMGFMVIFCLVGPITFSDSPWPMFHHDAFHTGRSPYVGPQTNDLQWRYQTGGEVWSSPAVGNDGTIYVGSYDFYVYALNPDGTLKWRYQTGYGVISSPVVGSDGTIYVGSSDDYIYAFNPDGTLKWRYQTGDVVESSPAVGNDGTIYVGSRDNYVYAFNPDGTLKWRYQTGNWVSSSPAMGGDGTIYVGSLDGYIYALNPDGTLKWRYQTGNYVISSPAVGSDGTIYVGSYDFYLYALNPDGTLKWRYQTGSYIWSSPAVGSDGTIYVGSLDHYLYAIGGQAGTPTPPPTGTPTSVPPTATPSCEVLGCTLDLPSHLYHPGDTFYANVVVCNPDPVNLGPHYLFVLLDIYGNYYFAPSFAMDLDYYEIEAVPGIQMFDVVPAFAWPPDTGEASGIFFYAAMTDTGITDLFGEMDIFEFGWTE